MIRLSYLILVCLFPTLCSALEIGDRAPDFNLVSLQNQQQIQLRDYEGKVRLVDFWASWCAPCRVSFPEIINLHKEIKSKDFAVIAISVDTRTVEATRFLSRFHLDYPVLHDIEGTVAESYQLPGMPTSFVINRQGLITMIHKGYRAGDAENIRAHIKSLLAAES